MLQAAPATRKVLWFGRIVFLGATAIYVIAHFHEMFTSLGIHTQPPIWWFVIAHVVAISGALATGYLIMYVHPSRWKWLFGIVIAGLSYLIVMLAIAWGVPSLSVHFGARPVIISEKISGTFDHSRGPEGFTFGPWYAPRGSAFHKNPMAMTGTILVMEGVGNSWATRITHITRFSSINRADTR